MSDVYKISVSIAATNSASAVLGILRRDVLALESSVVGLNKSLRGIGAGMGAMAGVFGVAEVIKGYKTLYEHGAKLVDQQALFREQFRQMPGMTLGKLNEMTTSANSQAYKTASEVLTSSVTENMKSIRELVGVFGDLEDAQRNLTVVTKAQSVMGTLLGHGAGDQVFALAKALEIKGVSQDPEHRNRLLDMMVKASVASGAKVLGSDFFNTFKYGRTATIGWSDKFVGEYLPTLIQEMKSGGGSGGAGGPGNALQSAFQAVVGGVMSNKAAGEFLRLGLLDPSKIIRTKTGSVKGIQPHGVSGSDEFQADPYQWVQHYLMPALQSKGITSPEGIRDEVSHMFVNRTAQQIMTMFATQQTRFDKDAALNRGASGIGAYDTLQQNSPAAKMEAFTKAWENLLTALGTPLADPATTALIKIAHALNSLTQWAAGHQELILFIEKLGFGFSALALDIPPSLISAIQSLCHSFDELSSSGPRVATAVHVAVQAFEDAALNMMTFGLHGALKGVGDILGGLHPDIPRGPGPGGRGGSPASSGHGHSWNTLPRELFPPRDSPSFNSAPVRVTIDNPHDIGHAVSGGLARGMSRPNAGPSYDDYRHSYPAPAFGSLS